jgi:putative membrane protein
MPEKLIIAIDRDDDLGRKAGIESPVIGRDNVLHAAIKFATTDPEDSDVNTIFGAIKIYD